MEIFGFTPVNSTHIQAKTKKKLIFVCIFSGNEYIVHGGLAGEAPKKNFNFGQHNFKILLKD